MTKQLIVNADDYGMTAGVSAGIRHAHLHGILTSTTALMTRPNVETELLTATTECPKLGLGVHLNLTSGLPILHPDHVPSLMNMRDLNDHGLHKIELIVQLDIHEVEREWRAQIDKFIHVTGHAPDHLDSHHHSSYFTPELCALMLTLAREYHCPIRTPLPSIDDAGDVFDQLPTPELVARAKQEVTQLLRESIDVRKPDRFLHSFYDETVTQEVLLSLIDSITDGVTELMTHPGQHDDDLTSFSVYNAPRVRELELLTDPVVIDRVKANGIELISFGKLK